MAYATRDGRPTLTFKIELAPTHMFELPLVDRGLRATYGKTTMSGAEADAYTYNPIYALEPYAWADQWPSCLLFVHDPKKWNDYGKT